MLPRMRLAAAAIAGAGAAWQISLLLRLFLGRFRYPWDIEWLESSALYQAYRVQQGLSTYGPFKDGYIPLNHPPGYPFFLGMVGKLWGVDYAMARSLSLLFFAGAAALVVRGFLRHAREVEEKAPDAPPVKLEAWALGGVAVGIAIAGVPVSEGFYDLVREDVMAVFLVVLGASLLDGPKRMSARRIALVSLVITAIVYTRQPAVFFPVWMVVHAFARHRRSGFFLALGAAALCGLVLVGIQFTSKGWYWMLTVGLMQNHFIDRARFWLGLATLERFAPFLAVIPLLALALAVRRRLSARAALWLGMLVAALPAALLPFAKVGGFSNDFVPALFMIGPAAGFVAFDLLLALRGRPRAGLAVSSTTLAALGVFLFIRTWDIKKLTPSPEMFRRAAALNARVQKLEGGVLAPRHPFMPVHNGHRTLEWSDMPYLDMMWSGYGELALGAYIDKAKARWAVVMGTEVPLTQRELVTRYQLEGPITEPPVTLVGERALHRHLLRLQDSEKGARVVFDFEGGLDGWTQVGDAFQITTAQPSGQGAIHGAVGQRLLNSFHPKKKDSATGTLTSPRFTIDRPRLAFRIGGGTRASTRVELRVGGKIERKAQPIFERNEVMLRTVWDVAPFMGKEAELVLVDQDTSGWGHLLLDHVVLY